MKHSIDNDLKHTLYLQAWELKALNVVLCDQSLTNDIYYTLQMTRTDASTDTMKARYIENEALLVLAHKAVRDMETKE